MKLTMIGSHLCQDTLYAMIKLKEKGAVIDFQNISAFFPALKLFLQKRENDPVFEPVKQEGKIGLPFFILEDGTETFDLDFVLKRLDEWSANSSAARG